MFVSPYTRADFPEISTWWESRDEGTLDPAVLPPVGVVALDTDGFRLAAAWLYQPVGCRVAIVDWLITRPGLTTNAARLACHAVFADICRIAKDGGATMLFCTVSRPGMRQEAEAAGFQLAAENVTHLFKPLT